jgi:ribonuclease HI
LRVFFCDGGCYNNGTPDSYAYGSFGEISGGTRRVTFAFHEASTNNQAEYMTLIYLLKELQSCEEAVEIRMDSQLVVNQVDIGRNTWKTKDPNLRRLRDKARELINSRRKYGTHLLWVRRDEIESVLGH